MEILHKVVLYSVLAFVVIGGAISVAGPDANRDEISAHGEKGLDRSISELELVSADDTENTDQTGT